jgi:hypothetical protein
MELPGTGLDLAREGAVMPKVVREIGVLSLGKVGGIIYACVGLLVGLIVAFVSILGGFAGLAHEGGAGAGIAGMFLGVGAIVALPILYGVLGSLVLMLVGAVYNVAARLVGGLEIEID